MCSGCFTGIEAAAVNAAAGAVLAGNGLARIRHRLRGRGPRDRRAAAYRANAEFVASLGLDPARVLGPSPEDRG